MAAAEPKLTIAQALKQRADAGLGIVTMHRIQKSSNVAGVGYDAKNRILYIEFLRGYRPRHGRLQKKVLKPNETVMYKYFNVPPYIIGQMMAAPSKGRFVWVRIRGRRYPTGGLYRYMRLGRKGWRGPVGGHRAPSTAQQRKGSSADQRKATPKRTKSASTKKRTRVRR